MHESLVSHWDPHWDYTGTTLGPYVDPIWDHVVDVFVGQLSVPPVVAQTAGPQKTPTTAHTTTMPTLSELQFLWAVVDVFVEQLSVPPVVAQTAGPQKHQQRPTQLPCQH